MSQRFFEQVQHAALYAKARPNAPPQLAERIINFLREKFQGELELCLDVGCGNGQCSGIFASSFRKVLATDISPAQIEVAKTLEYPQNIEFQVSPAENSPAENGSAQLVVACVAAHWFDLPAFLKDVDRVLCKNGVVALTSFFLPIVVHATKSNELNAELKRFYFEILGPYWGSGIRHLENEYADFSIPYAETLRDEVWSDEEPYTLARLAVDLESWSGYQNMCRDKGESAGREVLQEYISRCLASLGTTDDPAKVELKLQRKYFLLMGRKQ
ncbi:putative methyltransferase DDB_G0268948 [Daphnia magna]|uniref:putative methyltransferase DDB_G0268948 n=1 Tax=Daphnia magna TaxID=35525 RepID=UPI001E1BA69F|nr:putative methyltransferase DDB_G0268948 [Daphnia magna]